jgi:polyisoprenoid-binding protein YceI
VRFDGTARGKGLRSARPWPARACALAAGALFCALAGAAPLRAETLTLTPDQTRVRFELDSTLHAVEGTARLVSGQIHFSQEGGPASGSVVIDARSLETGNGMRDDNMHGKVLESERYPQIEFSPETLNVISHTGSVWEIELAGTTRIHGGAWPLTIQAQVEVERDVARVHGQFVIPHVAWGMRDMSNFLLSVEKQVHVDFDATGRLVPDSVENAVSPGGSNAPRDVSG